VTANDDAPANLVVLVDAVRFERNRATAECGGQFAAGIGSDHDLIAGEEVVDGDDRRKYTYRVHEAKPAEVMSVQKFTAFADGQYLSVFVRHFNFPSMQSSVVGLFGGHQAQCTLEL
jgi:hypothetical protein